MRRDVPFFVLIKVLLEAGVLLDQLLLPDDQPLRFLALFGKLSGQKGFLLIKGMLSALVVDGFFDL